MTDTEVLESLTSIKNIYESDKRYRVEFYTRCVNGICYNTRRSPITRTDDNLTQFVNDVEGLAKMYLKLQPLCTSRQKNITMSMIGLVQKQERREASGE